MNPNDPNFAEDAMLMGLRATALTAAAQSVGPSWKAVDIIARADRFMNYIQTGTNE